METSQLPHQANCRETYKYCTSFSVKCAPQKVRSECTCTQHAVGDWLGPPEKSVFKRGLPGTVQRLAFYIFTYMWH